MADNLDFDIDHELGLVQEEDAHVVPSSQGALVQKEDSPPLVNQIMGIMSRQVDLIDSLDLAGKSIGEILFDQNTIRRMSNDELTALLRVIFFGKKVSADFVVSVMGATNQNEFIKGLFGIINPKGMEELPKDVPRPSKEILEALGTLRKLLDERSR
jgi:hypothetical protein